MDAYPIFLKLEGASCLIVGGGEAAARKADLLLRAGASLTLVAPRVIAELADRAAAGELEHCAESFAPAHLRGRKLVIVATGDEALARRVSAAARAAGVLVNVVDRLEFSTFITGALVDRSPVLVAISTGGAAPVLAREIRATIERLLPTGLGRLAIFADRFRAAVKAAIADGTQRRRFWEHFFQSPVAEAVLAGNEPAARAAMLTLVNRPAEDAEARGRVYIVGAGPGDPDLLTLRALRLLSEADVILRDARIVDGILDRARRDAEWIDLGRGGDPRILLARHARAGRRVLRLVSGDPLASANVREELAYLRARDIAVELVPGVPVDAATRQVAAVNA
jgi:uroporphyrin-III C-methyltransferase/precorrin-2 dehydrogenase/sirohydrochlorin ferrochelatase